MMLEAKLEAHLRARVRGALGGMVLKLAPTVKGMPDRLVLLPGGRMFLIELKTDIGRLSPAQVEWHHRAAELGVTVYVLHGPDEVRQWVADRVNEMMPPRLQSGRRGRPKAEANHG